MRLEQGHPAERITALARELRADLTVLGSHGEGGVAAWNLGSTVQQVLAVARGSVLVARSSSSTVPSVACPKRILVPLDGSLRTESVLPTAARIANANAAELVLVHVVEEPQPTGVLHAPEDLDARAGARHPPRVPRAGDTWITFATSWPARVRRCARSSSATWTGSQALLELAEKEQTDLVVLSAHGVTCNVARSFGSVTAHLLAHSVVPLLGPAGPPRARASHGGRGRRGGRAAAPRRAYAPGAS